MLSMLYGRCNFVGKYMRALILHVLLERTNLICYEP
jgi:hypothetical protein